jgi:hypothetical protein
MWWPQNDRNNNRNAYNNVVVVSNNNQQSPSLSGVQPLLQVLPKPLASGFRATARIF